MGIPHTYEYVKEFIEISGDKLISETYEDSRDKLQIRCAQCGLIYEIIFKRYQKGFRHTKCLKKDLRTKEYIDLMIPRTNIIRTPSKPCQEIECMICHEIFKQKNSRQKICSKECNIALLSSRKGTGYCVETGRMGGLASARKQVRRSKNEIHFGDLCQEKFSNVLFNETMFDGWDADIILPDMKIAISYNGAWHYKQIRKGHSLSQVQCRDRIKDDIIKRYGYVHYVVKDMGSVNKKFVKTEFTKFLEFIKQEKIQITESMLVSPDKLKEIKLLRQQRQENNRLEKLSNAVSNESKKQENDLGFQKTEVPITPKKFILKIVSD